MSRVPLQPFAPFAMLGIVACSSDPETSSPPAATNTTSTAGTSSTGTAGPSSSSTSGATTGSSSSGGNACTNVRPTKTEWDEATCDQWASETDECDNDWMVDNDYCNESCGRCSPASSSTTTSTPTASSTTSSSTTGGGNCDGTLRTGGNEYCTSSLGDAGNGYSYQHWSDGSGSACMTVFGGDAAFKADWTNVGDFLARVGLTYDETRRPDRIGTFSSDFAFSKSGNDTAYIGFYGWTTDPLIEYYIIEDWMGDWRPNFTLEGTITVDGGSYDVYSNVRENAPSIRGNQTFTQYYSVRSEGRQCGHTSISRHFSEWAGLGLNLGNLYEVMLLAEGLNGGSGAVEFTEGTVVVN